MTKLLTTAEACEVLKVHRTTLRRLAILYRVKVFGKGRGKRYPESSIETIIEKRCRVAR